MNKLNFAVLATGLVLSTNVAAFADSAIVTTTLDQPVAESTTTTTTMSAPEDAVIVRDPVGVTQVIETPAATSATVQRTTTVETAAPVVESRTVTTKHRHLFW